MLNDEALRADLNWLNQQSMIQMSTSTWTMSGDEIQRALLRAQINSSTQQHVIDAIKNKLNADNVMLKASLFAEAGQKNISLINKKHNIKAL